MIVGPAARGQGIGRALLEAIETVARRDHVQTIRLETGPLNHEALGLYRRCGYRDRGPFGNYQPGPHSVFMEKSFQRCNR